MSSKRPHNNSNQENSDRKKKSKIEVPEFTSNDFFKNSVTVGDKSLSIIGYIDNISPTKTIKSKFDNKELEIFKFIINNNEGTRVHCFAWNEEAAEFSKQIFYNQIVLLEMLTVKESSNFNKGNVNFEFQLKKFSTITSFGCFNNESFTVNFEDIYKSHGAIKLEGYLKNEFVNTRKNDSKEYLGVLTNLEYKIDVTVFNCEKKLEFERGQKLSIIATILEDENKILYLEVQNPTNINLIDSTVVSLHKLLKGNKCITRSLE